MTTEVTEDMALDFLAMESRATHLNLTIPVAPLTGNKCLHGQRLNPANLIRSNDSYEPKASDFRKH